MIRVSYFNLDGKYHDIAPYFTLPAASIQRRAFVIQAKQHADRNFNYKLLFLGMKDSVATSTEARDREARSL